MSLPSAHPEGPSPLRSEVDFNPPTPSGVGPAAPSWGLRHSAYFNPPTPSGVGLLPHQHGYELHAFQSTHPEWGGTRAPCATRHTIPFQSTHPEWGGTRMPEAADQRYQNFNPPIPSGVGQLRGQQLKSGELISIHPPRVGWDGYVTQLIEYAAKFQSTHPEWGGTIWSACLPEIRDIFQSTHPEWGGTKKRSTSGKANGFQSTHPEWGGTLDAAAEEAESAISIHPPRVGWDPGTRYGRRPQQTDFNPPTPSGVGLVASKAAHRALRDFNPPTPSGVGQRHGMDVDTQNKFQSTHPEWGGTSSVRPPGNRDSDFNPPTPSGVGLQWRDHR